jgi:hypothetical protein
MGAALPVAKLRSLVAELHAHHGEFQGLAGEIKLERRRELAAVLVPCRFERNTLVVRVVFDADHAVAGLFIQPYTDAVVSAAIRFVDLLAHGQFTEAHASFDSTMKQALPVAELEASWKKAIAEAGPFEARADTTVSSVGGHSVVRVVCRFREKPLVVQIAYDREGRVAGLFYRPHAQYRTPPYADPTSYAEVDITVGAGDLALPGTLSLPRGDGPFPVVVLVHGSGPNDRDETLGPNKPFRDLAWGLASRGIAVLRYDKRTKVHEVDPDRITPKEETIDDAAEAVRLLRARSDVDAVFVAGHSMGGEMIPRIAQAAPDASGFVVIAGNTRHLEDLIVEQTRHLLGVDGSLSEKDKVQIGKSEHDAELVRELRRTGVLPDGARPFGLSAAYWRYLAGYEPAREAKSIKRPMLVLQGERDYQVTMADFAGWKKALAGVRGVTFKSYPRLNHLLFAGEGPSSPDEYEAGGNVDLELIEDVAKFVKSTAQARHRARQTNCVSTRGSVW